MTQITLAERFARAAAVGAAGLIVALTITYFDRHFRADMGFLRCATAGAFLAGLIVARGFGGDGVWGWWRAGFSFAIATVLGAFFAVFLLPLDEALMRTDFMRALTNMSGATFLGPIYVIGSMGDSIGVAFAWAAAFSGIQVLALCSKPGG